MGTMNKDWIEIQRLLRNLIVACKKAGIWGGGKSWAGYYVSFSVKEKKLEVLK